jgi:LPXTG-site transpeptidase (sortase) family protein
MMSARRGVTVWISMVALAVLAGVAPVVLGSPSVAYADKLGVCGVPGKDGPTTTLSGIVNSYYPGSANAAAGATSIVLGARDTRGSATTISAGDLLLVIQMQGAQIATDNDMRYGTGLGTPGDQTQPGSGNNGTSFAAGQYEYVIAQNAVGDAGGTLNLTTGLVNGYSTAAFGAQGQVRFQVVRVPQYSSVTLGGTVTAPAWNGSAGGLAALDVAGSLNLNGNTIDVSGLGFRGGAGIQMGGDNTHNNLDYSTLAPDVLDIPDQTAGAGGTAPAPRNGLNTTNASKGEGTAGTPRYVNVLTGGIPALVDTGVQGYPNGSMGRGAPGNAGGGGTDGGPATNEYNSGGGGGGNGGAGGHGGNSYRQNVADGGWGGSVFGSLGASAVAPTRLVMGGGGGAGTTNNGTYSYYNGTTVQDDPATGAAAVALLGFPPALLSSGQPGGGIVMVRAGTVTGSGTINARGRSAYRVTTSPNANAIYEVNWDGGGGGGAGGSVVVIAQNPSTPTLTINAQGGDGGNTNHQRAGSPPPHGPGGGGGGGVVYTSFPIANAANAVLGGIHGWSGNAVPWDSQFNTIDGSAGVVNATTTSANTVNSIAGAACLPAFTVVKTTSTPGPMTVPNTATYTITVSNSPGRGLASGASISDVLPSGFTYASNLNPVYAGGASGPATIGNSGTPGTPVFGVPGGDATNSFTIPGAGSVSITFTVNIGAGVPPGTYQNPARVDYTDPTRTASGQTVTPGAAYASGGGTAGGSNYDPASSTGEDVTVIPMPPSISKSFAPDPIAVGDTSTLSFSISNPNSGTILTGVAFSDTIPAGLTVASSSSSQCGGTLTTTAPSTIALSGGTIAASSFCSFSVTVTGITPGLKSNTTGTVTSTNGGSGNTASDTLTVIGPPSIAKAFAPATIAVGGISTLTFSITNPAANTVALTGVTFSDGLPAGVQVAVTPNASTSPGCGSPTFAPAASDTTLSFSAGTIAVAGTCTVSVDVTATTAGTKNNTSGNVSSTNGGTGNTASDTLTVTAILPPSISKSFAPDPIAVGDTSTLSFSISNPNSGTILTGVAFSDTIPAGLTVASSSSSQCGGTLTTTAPSTIALSGGTIAASSFCSFSVTVTGITPGLKSNTTGTVTSTNGGSGNTASDTLTVIGPPSIAKAFAPATIAVGGISTLTFSITNPAANTVALTGVTFSDGLPAGVQVAVTPNASTSPGCGSPTFAPAASDTTLSFSAGTIAVAGTCTVSVDVTATTAGTKNNTSGNVSSTNGGTGNTASDTLTVTATTISDPGVTKTGNPATAQVGDIVTFTIVVTNNGTANADSVLLTDPLPAFLNVVNVTVAPAGPTPGIVGNTVTVSFGTMIPAQTFTVTITTVVNSLGLPPGGTNTATVSTTSAESDPNNDSSSALTTIVTASGNAAPATGFAPDRMTRLPAQPDALRYTDLGDLWIEIPNLGVKLPIVGVPLTEDGWDVTWLGSQAGYLNGTAFPTWKGNSVLTSHATLASGRAGPFRNLKSLRWDDTVIVHFAGQRYVYSVRSTSAVMANDASIFRHEERPWLTLVTCGGYDPKLSQYRYRIAVKAVLTSIEPEP